MQVALMIPCYIDLFYPEVGVAALELLEKLKAPSILKKSAALANGELGQLLKEKVDLIARAAQEVIDGRRDGEFPAKISLTAYRDIVYARPLSSLVFSLRSSLIYGCARGT